MRNVVSNTKKNKEKVASKKKVEFYNRDIVLDKIDELIKLHHLVRGIYTRIEPSAGSHMPIYRG